MRFRAARGWGLLGGAALLGVVIGCVVALWVPGVAAVSVGSAVAVAVFTVASARGKDVLERQAERRDARPLRMLAAGAGGRPLRVRDLDDPIVLRVHPAEAVVRDVAGERTLDRTPPYVRRDLHDELGGLIRRGGFVLVVGESTAGKTRAVYEAVRAVCPDHVLLVPAGREALTDVIVTAADTPRCVLWLDDLERFLGAGGLTPILLNRLLGRGWGHLVVAATMRSPEFDRYGAREETGVAGADLDAWRDARDILRLASVAGLSRRWTDGEIERARECDDDPRIRAALASIEKFGLAEVLAAGPELVRNWRNAWSPSAHPRGAALVAAAVDCRRAGMDEPVPLDLLADLSRHYLREHGGEVLRPESPADALAWATKTSHGASSLLLPSEGSDYYIAFDYLVDLPGLALVPSLTWQTLIGRAEPWQVFRIGETAARVMQHDVAAQAFREAAARGVPGADTAAEFYAAYGDQLHVRSAFEGLLEDRKERFGDKHPETLHVRLMYAESIADSPHSAKALEVFPELIRDLDEVLGRHHRDTLDARRWYAYSIGVCGDLPAAIGLLNDILPAHEEVFGNEHISTLLARHYLAFFVSEDEPQRALGMLDDMRARYVRVYGPDSPRVLQIRDLTGSTMWRSGVPLDEVLHHHQCLFHDRVRILGSDHAHTVVTKFRVAALLFETGQIEQADVLLAELIRESLGDGASEEDLQKIALRLTELRLAEDGRQLRSVRHKAMTVLRVFVALRGENDPITRKIAEVMSAAGVAAGP
ncbi:MULTISPECIES: hypothetical protein [unclassified Amycolatopsis]|uniref:hypothetical protein n=1 Tax=unclassified Amycolatopsis TaxID=2618356 RepID=UPI00287483BB|nr:MULTISPECIES: hypothetical protein [unclassified Amycolatopsis]MDS0134293.1 hypothetical protein [Amycolatopsis sp. 505]MDS0149608.1 hypothetical protein [Amycolatopsis sp. CM201R]